MTRIDVVVAGGGLVGASLACALGGGGLTVAVVEAGDSGAGGAPASFDDRYTALAPSSARFFDALGLWSGIAGEATPIREIHVSDRGRFGMTTMRAGEEGLEALGWVVPNRTLGRVLLPAVEDDDAVTVYRPARIADVELGADDVTVRIARHDGDDVALRTPLLVVADGADSQTRAALGVGRRETRYGQTAIVANVRPARDPRGRAFERFTREGPLALLPAPAGTAALVWTMPDESSQARMSLDDAAFLASLQDAFGYRLGRFQAIGSRQTYPLRAVSAERFVAPRAAIIGNAAHTLHPVAGQGFNLAVRDVASLAELIDEAARSGDDPGRAELLADYARSRRADYRRTFAFTDGLVRSFSHALPLIAPMRNLALVGLELMPGARRTLMRRAMGRGGRLPRLARGLPLGGEG